MRRVVRPAGRHERQGSAAAGDAFKRHGEQPTGGYNTAKGVAAGLHNVVRNEPLRKAGSPATAHPSCQRASGGAMPAGALPFDHRLPSRNLGTQQAGSVPQRSFAGQLGLALIGKR